MENASNALIIAGAILLSILIIALGVFVFNQAKGAMGNTGLDDQKAAANNQKFEAYEGGAVKGSQVKSLLDIVRTNNNSVTNDNDYCKVIITVTGVSNAGTYKSGSDQQTSENIADLKNAIESSKQYSVEITNYSDSGSTKGYVSGITIGF